MDSNKFLRNISLTFGFMSIILYLIFFTLSTDIAKTNILFCALSCTGIQFLFIILMYYDSHR